LEGSHGVEVWIVGFHMSIHLLKIRAVRLSWDTKRSRGHTCTVPFTFDLKPFVGDNERWNHHLGTFNEIDVWGSSSCIAGKRDMLRHDRASDEDLCRFVSEKAGAIHWEETCDLEGCEENSPQGDH
jgi:hypothetical protein